MTEFALVAPVLLVLTFGILDFGRALYYYAAAGNAAREGAHVAVRATSPNLPTDADVKAAVAVHFPGVTMVAPSPNCPNDPTPGGMPPAGSAWVFVNAPAPAVPGEVGTPANAPGGEQPVTNPPCQPMVPAIHRQLLEVTVVYNYVPVTPLISSVFANHIVFTLRVLARTEY